MDIMPVGDSSEKRQEPGWSTSSRHVETRTSATAGPAGHGHQQEGPVKSAASLYEMSEAEAEGKKAQTGTEGWPPAKPVTKQAMVKYSATMGSLVHFAYVPPQTAPNITATEVGCNAIKSWIISVLDSI